MKEQLKAKTAEIKDWLTNKVNVNNHAHRQAIGRALLIVYNNQTQDEKRDEQTKHHNDKGFAGNNAKFGTSVAKYFLRNNDMSVKQAARVARMLIRHARQIARKTLENENQA